MVCEPPRMRPLLVRKRGQFFEDPFFRDAWGDYSHAVRRIVDRFNHGWVTSSESLRDSQCHSMYRTLRTARLNYSSHSARFKEEGNVYKLVMDVHEFVGGDITVRTAGRTVSVKGKVEAMGPSGETTLTSKVAKDDDTSSVSSGMSSSSQTLHRRFTLPIDADCEKVESSLSKDAVLTVTIPKKSDVHYIPVRIEGDSSHINSERNELNMNRGGIKRPSDSKTESNRKKSQERFESQDPGRRSRYDVFYSNNSAPDPRKRTYEESKENLLPRKNPIERRNTRRENKYEEVHEINIPVEINTKDTKDRVFRPRSLTAEPKVHFIEIQTERPKSSIETGDFEYPIKPERLEKRIRKSANSSIESDSPKVSRRRDTTEALNSNYRDSLKEKSISLGRILNSQVRDQPLSKLGCSEGSTMHSSPELTDKGRETQKGSFVERTSQYKPLDLSKIYTVPSDKYEALVNRCSSSEQASSDEINDPLSAVSSSLNLSHKGSNSRLLSSSDDAETVERAKELQANPLNANTDNASSDTCISIEQSLGNSDKTLKIDTLPLGERKPSPPSPGGREVKVEKGQTCMEDDIFRDCWSDFSNTLQEVLFRLQELSSELGHSRLFATTPSEDTKELNRLLNCCWLVGIDLTLEITPKEEIPRCQIEIMLAN